MATLDLTDALDNDRDDAPVTEVNSLTECTDDREAVAEAIADEAATSATAEPPEEPDAIKEPAADPPAASESTDAAGGNACESHNPKFAAAATMLLTRYLELRAAKARWKAAKRSVENLTKPSIAVTEAPAIPRPARRAAKPKPAETAIDAALLVPPTELPPDAVGCVVVRLLVDIDEPGWTSDDIRAGRMVQAFTDSDGATFLARKRDDGTWADVGLNRNEFTTIKTLANSTPNATFKAAATEAIELSDEDRAAPVAALPITTKAVDSLCAAGLKTAGDIADWIAAGNELTAIDGIGRAKAAKIHQALARVARNDGK